MVFADPAVRTLTQAAHTFLMYVNKPAAAQIRRGQALTHVICDTPHFCLMNWIIEQSNESQFSRRLYLKVYKRIEFPPSAHKSK